MGTCPDSQQNGRTMSGPVAADSKPTSPGTMSSTDVPRVATIELNQWKVENALATYLKALRK